MIEELRRVSDADQASHGQWYGQISNELVALEEEALM